ncbi:hypothetical protein ANO14919_054400 [Xylariales sp. No.14919]|nr:hypothetical protein ANO14919_054400 [Xylariales sp. No.14919]
MIIRQEAELGASSDSGLAGVCDVAQHMPYHNAFRRQDRVRAEYAVSTDLFRHEKKYGI